MRANTQPKFTIGKLAGQAGVKIDTIRFYEREGLLAEPARRASGYREYGHETLHRIRFIRRAQELGFTLREVAELLGLKARRVASCTVVKSRADAKMAEIDGKIHDLKRIKSALGRISDCCASRCTTEDCPIEDCFEGGCCK